MAERWRIRKGDKVIIRTGRDKGKIGEVVEVLREQMRVVVRGVNVVKRHTRPTQSQAGGIIQKELAIHVSNVAHIDPETGKATRVGMKFLENGEKVRYAKVSGKLI